MSAEKQITVAIAHHDPVVQAGLSSAFSGVADIQVESGFENDEQLTEILRSPLINHVDVVVTDYASGMAFAAAQASFKVMVLASTDREWDIRRALQGGVRGYVIAGSTLKEIVAGVRAVGRGARYLSPVIAQRLADSMAGERLTAREEDTVRLITEGLCNKAIARQLGITVGTVKSHLKAAFGKLNVRSRTQAAAAVERRGLLGIQGVTDRHSPGLGRPGGLVHPTFRPGGHQGGNPA